MLVAPNGSKNFELKTCHMMSAKSFIPQYGEMREVKDLTYVISSFPGLELAAVEESMHFAIKF